MHIKIVVGHYSKHLTHITISGEIHYGGGRHLEFSHWNSHSIGRTWVLASMFVHRVSNTSHLWLAITLTHINGFW